VIVAFQDLGSLLLGYGLVLGLAGAYAARIALRGRRLARRLPDSDKPWA
jgi:hypothetical protein